MIDEKKATLARARKWLSGVLTSEAIRYAALDLRVIMEMLTYEKLEDAADVIPPAVLKTWQPPQAVKSLVEFQPMADKSFSISIGMLPVETTRHEDQEWMPIGSHHALTGQWLKKNYNRVGNIVHAPNPLSSPKTLDVQKASLTKIADELEAALASTIKILTERGGLDFKCSQCGSLVIRNKAAMLSGALAHCPSAECGAEFKLDDPAADPPTVSLVGPTIACPECKTSFGVPRSKVQDHGRVKCPSCSSNFEMLMLSVQFALGRLPEGA